MGILKPSVANSMRATYSEILKHYQQGTSPSTVLPENLDLAELLRQHPELAQLLEPILSREQIEQMLRGQA